MSFKNFRANYQPSRFWADFGWISVQIDCGALLNTFWSNIFNVHVTGSTGHGRQQERRRRPRTTMFKLTVRRSLERRDVHDQQQQRPARFHGAAASTVGTPASIALLIL